MSKHYQLFAAAAAVNISIYKMHNWIFHWIILTTNVFCLFVCLFILF